MLQSGDGGDDLTVVIGKEFRVKPAQIPFPPQFGFAPCEASANFAAREQDPWVGDCAGFPCRPI